MIIEETMPLIPLRGLTVFPGMVLHFVIGREKSILALERAMMLNQTVFLTSQKNADTDLPTEGDLYRVGTVARVKQMLKLPGDNIRVLVDGQYRAELTTLIQEVPFFLCSVTEVEDSGSDPGSADIIALKRAALGAFREYTEKHPKLSAEIMNTVSSIDEPGRLADIIASNLDLKTEDSQAVLEETDVAKRLDLIIELLLRENEIMQIEDK
ncbi:MAG: LON peptidase substrate-binding domain-containing protein, partial [Firmicutes bacterium]|nr:LON peptidase substrate-binding domain-containing protein [Bacillota bacterium]